MEKSLPLYVHILQNGQIHSNNSSTVADELRECIWRYCVGLALKGLMENFIFYAVKPFIRDTP